MIKESSITLDDIEVMVLSTGFEPLYRTNWKRAISDVISGKAEVIENHQGITIGTANGFFEAPATIRILTGILKFKIRNKNHNSKCYPSKRALYNRDDGKCQYCCKKIGFQSMTIDHVFPKSKGGDGDWTNLVVSCHDCNQRKGAKTLEESGMRLNKPPIKPWDYIGLIK
jgi:5-methylcytosine-specific restriction endonuclease McrA